MRAVPTTMHRFPRRFCSGLTRPNPSILRLLAFISVVACLATALARSSPAAEPDQPGAAPSSQPAAASGRRPETRPAGEAMVRAWADLAHRDPTVRETARLRLMSMSADQLPAFRRVVAASRPLAPSQAIALREIVTQVFLAGQTYEASSRAGFLGVVPGEINLALAPEQVVLPNPELPGVDRPAPGLAVVIDSRMPGFCAARSLQDGDVVLAIVERPEYHLNNAQLFSEVIQELGAGRLVHFRVLRRGRVITVPVTLDVRPDAANRELVGRMAELRDQRERAIREYWEAEFAPLLLSETAAGAGVNGGNGAASANRSGS